MASRAVPAGLLTHWKRTCSKESTERRTGRGPSPKGLKMNQRIMTILVAAFVIAGLCALIVFRMASARMAASKPAASTKIVAAATDIKLGTVLTAADLTTTEIVGSLPSGAILNQKDAINRGVVSNLFKGEPILESRLAAVGSGGGLAATIPVGMRACAVKVDEVVGVAGFATPGMRVDVLVSGIPPGTQDAGQGTVTKTILQNIEVLSAGTDIQKDAEGKPQQVQVVNLLVTPDQAETLSLASQQKIQLVLRNPLDTQVAALPNTAMNRLFVDQNAPAPQVRKAAPVQKPAPAFSVEVINGAARSEQKFASVGGQQ